MSDKTKKEYLCKCGRLAEVEVNGKCICWELYLIDNPLHWKVKYPGQKPRHQIDIKA